MTHTTSRRTAFFLSFLLSLLIVVTFAFAASVRADDGDVTTPDGDNGANAGQMVATSSDATSTDGTGGQHGDGGTVITGDATASTSVDTTLNSNDVNPDTACEADECTNSSTITATSTNDAVVGTFSTSTASTGANVADGGQGLATVVTGNAFAFANVINLINTNIFNSQGLLLFLNNVFSTGLDLRDFNLDYFFDGDAGASPTTNEDTGQPQCTLLTCLNSSQLNVLDTNVATVTNSVIVRADSGGNIATTTDDGLALPEEDACGDTVSGACVKTGDAYAAANVVNLVNTNIINSSYLLVSYNNFGDLDGNITLPNDDFFANFFAHGGSAPAMNSSTYGVYNNNNGTTTGTVATDANTGSSTAAATGEGSGIVSTGDAYSQSTSFTDMGHNYVGGSSVFFLFRVAGEWLGSAKSLPAGLHFDRYFDAATKDGVTSTSTMVLITSEDTDDNGVPDGSANGLQDPETDSTANCDKPTDTQDNPEGLPVNNCYNSSSFTASSTNTAVVENNIDVAANTGNNIAYTEDGVAHVITGDAYAIANAVNIINTNIVGRNWIFALFNVLGNWDGDISFGKSDLTLAAATDAPGTVSPGSTVDYSFTVTNNGDRDADDVVLDASFNKSLLSFGDQDGSQTDSGRRWTLPTIPRGQSRTVTFPARVGSIPSGTSMTVPITASVLSDGQGSDAQAAFTLAAVNVVSSGGGGGGGGGGTTRTVARPSKAAAPVPDSSLKQPSLTVEKSVTGISTTSPTTVDYKVVVTNAKDAGPLYGGALSDTLFNPDGSILYNRGWNLDAVAPGDQITLTYSVQFSATSTPGVYRNIATVTGDMFKLGSGKPALPVQGMQTVTINSAGAVLGAASDCSLAVSVPLRYGMTNAEVAKLQTFLNTQGSALPATGFYGPLTTAAVNAFQNKYAADILAPLGLRGPTGAVAGMTIKKIRALACADTAPAASSSL